MSQGITDISILKIEKEAVKDDRYKEIYTAAMNDFVGFEFKYGAWTKPHKYQYVRDFKPQWSNLSTYGKLVVLNNSIFIPENCRREILHNLHNGHQGVTRTLQNARQSVYWHGITKDVQNMCAECEECQRLRPSIQKETLEADELPKRPFDCVSADLFQIGT